MPLHRFPFRAMASPCALAIVAPDADTARHAADAAIAEIARIEAKYSRYRDDSVTTAINRAAGGSAVAIDAETDALLDYAHRCHELSAGAFDLTSGVLRHAWDFRRVPPRLPQSDALAAALDLIGWGRVERGPPSVPAPASPPAASGIGATAPPASGAATGAGWVRLPRAGMEIDFGGIGKEYAADRAATLLAERGIAGALVDLGGDVRALGAQDGGASWRVGIRHPRGTRPDEAIAAIEVVDAAVATSGDYERFIEIDGRRYCHILDPRSGWPVTHWQSVSVVAPLATVAGSCATIAMLLGAQAPDFLDAQGVRWLGVAADGRRCGEA
jgi:thiamine biosynthesis lipoprotein